MTAPESVACKVPDYPSPAVEKFSDSVLSAERCIQSQGLTTECGSKGLTAMSGQTMVQMRPSDASSHKLLGSLPECSHSLWEQQPSLLGASENGARKRRKFSYVLYVKWNRSGLRFTRRGFAFT